MTNVLWNVGMYSLQLAALAGIATLDALALRLRTPRFALRFWQWILGAALLLPFVQPDPVRQLAIIRSGAALVAPADGAARGVAGTGLDAATIIAMVLAAGILARLSWLALGLARLRRL